MHITAVHLVRIISWKAGRPLSSSLLWLRVSCWQAMQAAGLQRTWPRDTAVTAPWWCSRWCSHLTLLSQPPLRTACSFEYPGRALPTVSLTKSGTNLFTLCASGARDSFFRKFFYSSGCSTGEASDLLDCICLTQITLRTNNKPRISSLPEIGENTFLGEQAMRLRTVLLNTWMFIRLEPSPLPLMLLGWMTARWIRRSSAVPEWNPLMSVKGA